MIVNPKGGLAMIADYIESSPEAEPDLAPSATACADLEVRLLGSVDVVIDGRPREIPGLRRKRLLAALALDAGQVVSADLLVEIVWDGAVPATVTNTLQSTISYLRRLLGKPNAIVAAWSGYRLDPLVVRTDAQTAERLIADAQSVDDPDRKLAILEDALALWRDIPLADIRGQLWLNQRADRLQVLHRLGSKMLMETELLRGRHAVLIPRLEILVAEYPFDEGLHAELMLALYRAGRQIDALTVFRRLRSRLVDELAIEPGRPIRDIEKAILRQDPAIDLPPGATEMQEPAPMWRKPTQLPAISIDVVGRDSQVDVLEDVLAGSGRGRTGLSGPTVAISGMPGVGKTTLALQWAHRSAPAFSDGHLFADLRGFDALADPLAPADVLRVFLESLGMAARLLPRDLQQLTGLYRTVLADKSILIVLDNALDAAQVRPLLPSSPGCMAIVTSRSDLSPLAITHSAHQLRLAPLSKAASMELIRRRVGVAGLQGQDGSVREIAAYCAGLPLALTILAARVVAEDQTSLGVVADQIRRDEFGLAILDGGDPATDVRQLFYQSHRRLGALAERVFRHLDMAMDGGVTTAGLGSALTLSDHECRTALRELERASLIDCQARDHYDINPLVRRYVVEANARAPHDLVATGHSQPLL